MALITWDTDGSRNYQTGIDRVALYEKDANGVFKVSAAWNGVSALNESPSGAESNKIYADNIEYLNLISNEELSVTLEAYTSPEEFDKYDGMQTVSTVIKIHGQTRGSFGLAYRIWKGNDQTEAGQKDLFEYHILYNCKAGVASRDNATINDSPEAGTFSWEISTSKCASDKVPNGTSVMSHVIIDFSVVTNDTSRKNAVTALENLLFDSTNGYLPWPSELASAQSCQTLNI